MSQAHVLFVVIYLLNVIPAFAPPTWMALSLLGFNRPEINLRWLALVAALAAAAGRSTLARLSRTLIRQRLLTEAARHNIDAIREKLERRPILTAGMFLFYAFSPLPSNYLFIAYGLTSMRLRLIIEPFFVGRLVSYNFWMLGASMAARHLELESPDALAYSSVYFILSQCLFLGLIYGFARLDWRALLYRRELRWRTRSGNGPGVG